MFTTIYIYLPYTIKACMKTKAVVFTRCLSYSNGIFTKQYTDCDNVCIHMLCLLSCYCVLHSCEWFIKAFRHTTKQQVQTASTLLLYILSNLYKYTIHMDTSKFIYNKQRKYNLNPDKHFVQGYS